MGLKNIWSLNVDELLVADEIKQNFDKKKLEVFFPLNSQMKDVDLVTINLKTNKAKTIQVKGSRTYKPRKSEVERYGNGGAAWFKIKKDSIFKPINKLDFFIFVLHSFVDGKIKKEIKIDFLIIPLKELHKVCNKKKIRKGEFYHFFIWIDSMGKRAFDFNNTNGKEIYLSKFINDWRLIEK